MGASASSGSQRSRSSAGSEPRTVVPRRSGILTVSPVTGLSVITEQEEKIGPVVFALSGKHVKPALFAVISGAQKSL